MDILFVAIIRPDITNAMLANRRIDF
jgi:hypothetical protein